MINRYYQQVLKPLLAVVVIFSLVLGGLWLELIGITTDSRLGTVIDTRCKALVHGSVCYSRVMTSTGETVKAISNCQDYHDGRSVNLLVGAGYFSGKTRYSVDCF